MMKSLPIINSSLTLMEKPQDCVPESLLYPDGSKVFLDERAQIIPMLIDAMFQYKFPPPIHGGFAKCPVGLRGKSVPPRDTN